MEEFMYRVIEMYGDCEPWWFLEGWEDDIVSSRKFEDYYQALKYYKQKWLELNEHFPSYKSRSDLMTIFWDTKEQEWCEDCSEDVQLFHSIVLLEDASLQSSHHSCSLVSQKIVMRSLRLL